MFPKTFKFTKPLSQVYIQDFPGGTVDRNLPCQCREHWFDPWSGKIPCAVGQLSSWDTTIEACVPRVRALQQEMPPQ